MNSGNSKYTFPLVVLIVLFFLWGFITCMNDILIPYLKSVFSLTHTRAMLIQGAFFGAYFIGSLIYFLISAVSGDPMNKIGYKNGIVAGLLISALGTALFFPAAEFKIYAFFLTALFVLGLGFTLLQIAANPFVAILGKENTASSRLNLAQGFNSLGTTIAPLIGGYLVFKFFTGSEFSGADSVKVPYLIFSGVFVLMAVFFMLIKLPVFFNKEDVVRGAGALRYPNLAFGMVAILMYVGAEVSIGSILISYLKLPEIAGLEEAAASHYVAFYWGGLMIGRFLGAISLGSLKSLYKYLLMLGTGGLSFGVIWYVQDLRIATIYSVFLVLSLVVFMIGRSLPARTLFLFSLMAVALLAFSMFRTGEAAMWSVIGVGLFNSIMWSNIFTLAIAGLGKHTSQGSSLLVMAIVGGALLPVLMGVVADYSGVRNAFIVPLLAYTYVAFYGLRGYKQKKVI